MEEKRKLDVMPYDKAFNVGRNGNEELCHATGYEVCHGDLNTTEDNLKGGREMSKKEVYKVQYAGGESRYGKDGVDYMFCKLDDEDELYEEFPAVEGDDNANYEELKSAIIEQAKKRNIKRESLKFWYDD